MPALFLIGVALWFLFGDPVKTVANTFWEHDAAPWETVDAFYYPNRNDLTQHEQVLGFDSVEGCRAAVRSMASRYNDLDLKQGDYECGIGKSGTYGALSVYRQTAE